MAAPANRETSLWVLRKLRQAGFIAYFAGGCVRDMLLGIPCSDYDIATDATPDQVRRLFGHVLLVGAKFGVAMVIREGKKVEVTTFRSDLSYADGRRPEGVTFTTAREDAQRRDFTINGMFHDPITDEVIDYVGGRDDLAARVIRTIGDPQERFGEDYLRLIRAARFAVRLGFAIDPATAAAGRELAGRITGISGERIFEELSKMLSLPSASDALRKLAELELARHILPELFADDADAWQRALARVEQVAAEKDLKLALGAMLFELTPANVRAIVRRWGASNDLRDELAYLAAHREDWQSAATMPLCEFKRIMGGVATRIGPVAEIELSALPPEFKRLMALWRLEETRQTGKQAQTSAIARRVESIPPERIAPRPLVSGVDLMALGVSQGPKLGKLSKAIYDAQLNEQIATPQQGLDLAKELLGR